jgi:hypothetical protein
MIQHDTRVFGIIKVPIKIKKVAFEMVIMFEIATFSSCQLVVKHWGACNSFQRVIRSGAIAEDEVNEGSPFNQSAHRFDVSPAIRARVSFALSERSISRSKMGFFRKAL